MSKKNLYKGFEVELFTGSFNSHIGVSADIEKIFSNFVKEPDNRNVKRGQCSARIKESRLTSGRI